MGGDDKCQSPIMISRLLISDRVGLPPDVFIETQSESSEPLFPRRTAAAVLLSAPLYSAQEATLGQETKESFVGTSFRERGVGLCSKFCVCVSWGRERRAEIVVDEGSSSSSPFSL